MGGVILLTVLHEIANAYDGSTTLPEPWLPPQQFGFRYGVKQGYTAVDQVTNPPNLQNLTQLLAK